MSRRIQRLLWRFGCGLVSEDRLEQALEERCRQLLDRRFEHPATKAEGAWEAKPALSLLHEFEFTLGLARAHTRSHKFRRAYRALRRAEDALQGVIELLETSCRLKEVRERWRRFTDELGLEPLRCFASLRSMEVILRVGQRCLSQGEAAKAEAVVRLAQARIEALGLSENGPTGDGEGRRDGSGAKLVTSKGRLHRLRTEGEPPMVQCLEWMLEKGYTKLGARLLEDWEMGLLERRESDQASRETERFQELIHRSGELSAQLEHLTSAEGRPLMADRGEIYD